MGVDFAALLRIPSDPAVTAERVDSLARARPEEVRAVQRLWIQEGYWDHGVESPRWSGAVDRSGVLALPEGISLTFGPDWLLVLHLVRLHTFLTEPPWRDVLIEATRALARHFGAS